MRLLACDASALSDDAAPILSKHESPLRNWANAEESFPTRGVVIRIGSG